MDLCVLHIECKWNLCVWLLSLRMLLVHPWCSLYQDYIPFLWLNNIPLYKYTILFIYSSSDGYLDWFQRLANVGSAAVNSCVQACVWIRFQFFGACNERNYWITQFNFLRICHTICHIGYTILPTVYLNSNLSTSLRTYFCFTIVLVSFIFHYGFDLKFS